MTTNKHESVDRNARYAKHISELCRAFKIRLVIVKRNFKPEQSVAGDVPGTDRRAIMISPVVDESTYAVALHELGHCLHPLGAVHHVEGSKLMRTENECGTLRDVRLRLTAERSAWEWAHHYALEWTPLMSQVESWALGSYERDARQKGAM